MASLVSQLVLQPLSQELLESILKDELNPGVVTTEDLNLLTSIKIRNTTYSVTWSSDKPAITNMGIVTRPEAGEDNVVVTLTAVVKNDINETIATLYFEVVVLAEIVDAEPVTVTASYTGETGNMTEGNNASEINLDQNIFTVTSIKRENSPLHIGLNVAGQIRLYGSTNGNGNILEISIANGYKITNVKFNFGSTVGNALIKIGDEIKFSGALTANSSKEFSDLNDTSFSIQNKNSGTGQIYILSIEITYIPG